MPDLQPAHRTTFERIAVALDLSTDGDRALPVGSALARQAGVPLDLVVVGGPGMDPEVDDTELRRRVALSDVEPSLIVLRDDDAARSLETLGAEDGRVLCLSTHARGAIASAFVGSVSRHVVEHASRPTVLVGPSVHAHAARYDTIIVGVDPALPHERLVQAASGWAQVLDARVHLVAVEEPVSWMLTGRDVVGPALDDLLATDAARLAADGLDVRTTVVHVGRPATALVDVAEREGRCLIAVASGHRGSLSAVTTRVAHAAHVPVVVVPHDSDSG
jgi:nucleotide-binding universal stress UspA family protein